MQRSCPQCGAVIAASAAVCPNCGKVVGQSRSGQPNRRPAATAPHPQQRPPQGAKRAPQQARPVPARPAVKKTPQRPAAQRPVRKTAPRPAPMPVHSTPAPAAPVKKEKIRSPEHILMMRRIYQGLTVAVVVTALYIIIYMIQVFRVRTSTYKFDKLNMKLSHTSYGTAFNDYFEDTHWYVNPFTMKVTFKGSSKHREEYEIVFTARAKVKLQSIGIDERQIDEKLFDEKMMGIFI